MIAKHDGNYGPYAQVGEDEDGYRKDYKRRKPLQNGCVLMDNMQSLRY